MKGLKMGIRTKTLLFLFLPLTLILVATGVISFIHLEKSIEYSVYREIDTLTSIQGECIAKFLEDALRDTRVVALNLPRGALERGDLRVVERYLGAMWEAYPKFSDGIFILEARGNLLVDYPSHPEIRGRNFAFREYFQATMKKGEGVIGVPYVSARTGEFVLTFTALLRDDSGRVMGLVGCSSKLLHPEVLSGVRKARIGESGYFYIFNKSRMMMVHPYDGWVGKEFPSGVKGLIDLVLEEGFEGVSEGVGFSGEPVIFSVRSIKGTDWFLVGERSRGEALAAVYDLRKRGVMWRVTALSVILLIGVLVLRKITGPIEKLRGASVGVGEIIQGRWEEEPGRKRDFIERLNGLESGDEIGDLARAFKGMYERLDRSMASLSHSARDWERTFDSVRDSIFILDGGNRIQRLNRSAANLLGVTFQEAVGRPCYRLVHGTDGPPDFCPQKKAFGVRGPVEVEVWEPNLNGYFEVSVSTVRDGGERVIGSVHVMRDITERKRAEEAIKLSEEKFSKAFSAAPVWVVLTTLREGRYIEVNEAFLRSTGFRRDEVIGKTSIELNIWLNPSDRDPFVAELRERGSIKNLEYKCRKKSGEIIDILYSAEVIEIAGEKLILSTSLDITDHKKIEEEIRASEERYRTLVESSSDGILLLSPEREILSCNKAFCNLFGYDRKEIEGKSIRILHLSDENFHSFGKVAYPELRANGSFRGEWELIRKDGAKVLVETVTSVIRSSEGSIMGYVSIIRDITERRRVEEERAVLQEQLRQSQKMEAIGLLAGGIAHDFNNILTVISGKCDLALLEIEERDPLRESIEVIKGAAGRAADLTRQLLAFSRKQILEPRVLDLNQVVRGVEKMLRRIIGETIELVLNPEGSIWKVKADPGQIEQVIMNLVVNARDAMPNGGRLTIETANVELDKVYTYKHAMVPPGPYVMLSVSDTGVGMTEEVKERIFEPFFTTKEKGKGTGLGLSTVYGIVKQSGGYIWVYSELGRGTTFKIYFPRVDEPLDGVRREDVLGEIPRGSETILLVEDDEAVRDMVMGILKGLGYKVLSARSGMEALEMYREVGEPIHLVLTDVVMPGMSGRELWDCLRGIDPEVRVLFMSGYPDDAIAHHGVLDAGVHYIQKPVTLDGLARKVRRVLGQ